MSFCTVQKADSEYVVSKLRNTSHDLYFLSTYVSSDSSVRLGITEVLFHRVERPFLIGSAQRPVEIELMKLFMGCLRSRSTLNIFQEQWFVM